MSAALLWLRNDLRVRDNQLFHYQAVRGARQHLALYCIDPRHFAPSRWGGPPPGSTKYSAGESCAGHLRTGEHRARFIAESLVELEASLTRAGSRLVVVVGRPEHIVPCVLARLGAAAEAEEPESGRRPARARAAPGAKSPVLAFQAEDTYEEQRVEKVLLERLGAAAEGAERPLVLQHKHHTLLNREDLEWDPEQFLPMPFGKFWHEDCQRVQPREELPRLQKGDLPPPAKLDEKQLQEALSAQADAAVAGATAAARVLPSPLSLEALASSMGCREGSFGKPAPAAEGAGTAEFVWHGGEAAAAERMRQYASPEGLGTHMQTRNRFHGLDSFSRLSPWLANGCLSPRTVYWWLKRYFDAQPGRGKQGGFDHFHKYVFQLAWRDFFRFYCARFGPQVFFLEGGSGKKRAWRRDAEAEGRWKLGRTGVPIVDAFMRELLATGYMSNRGRYTVASYLIFFLRIDWRVGADWFESLLVDHDVCSNYGEWASMANVAVDLGKHYPLGLKGRGPTDNRDKGRRGGGGDPWASGASSTGGILPGDAVFCPYEQAAQYDKKEEFVRRWVPEIGELPAGQAHRPPLDCALLLEGRYPAPLATKVDVPLGLLGKVEASESGCDGEPPPYGRYYRHRVLWAASEEGPRGGGRRAGTTAAKAGGAAREARSLVEASPRKVFLVEDVPAPRQDAAGYPDSRADKPERPTRRWRARAPQRFYEG